MEDRASAQYLTITTYILGWLMVPLSSLKMDRGWCIGPDRIPSSKSGHQFFRPYNVSRPINLTEIIKNNNQDAVRKPVLIRPPTPRLVSPQKELQYHKGLSYEPMPKPIIRRRSRSLPSTTERKKHSRVGVRFIDSLGLDLENIRVFRTGEDPSVPQHVTFRLLMGAELADKRCLEISLPYLKPVFAEQPGDQAEFLNRLHQQKVCLERVLCCELGIIGIAQVLNLGYEKEVIVRYSFTEWKSRTETKASWLTTTTKTWDERGGQLSCDSFRFHLPVPPFLLQPGAVLEFAIQYKVHGTEYWDNNDGENYKLLCHSYKLAVPKECADSMVHFI